jgi:undecaprenyl-diphosphatase
MVILGLVQGLTEFLPVSSTAHLLFTESFLGIERPGILLEAVLHLGTALAALIVFWDDARRIVVGWITGKEPEYRRLAWLIVLVTAITALIGLLLAEQFEHLYGSIRGVAFQLILSGVILLLARERGARQMTDIHASDAAVLGLAQAVSIVPGISRSGTTIAGGMWVGLRREDAAKLSFLIAIPSVAGAGLFGLKDLEAGASLGYGPFHLLVGFAVALISGVMAIKWLLLIVRRGRLGAFAAYCIVVGLAVLAATFRA